LEQNIMLKWIASMLMIFSMIHASSALAIDGADKVGLAAGENESRIAMLDKILAQADTSALPFLQLMLDDAIKIEGTNVYVVSDEATTDALTGKTVALSDTAEDVVNNNQMRTELEAAISALNLLSDDEVLRKASAESLVGTAPSAGRLALIQKVELTEKNKAIKELLVVVRASMQIASIDKPTRLAAIQTLADNDSPGVKQLLSSRLQADGETDAEVIKVLKQALKTIDSHLATYERLGQIFTGISLGSILLLAALGLAVTFGLMGVINMAHGEMMMIGAYATYVVQNLFLHYLPDHFQWYLVAAVPGAFIVTAMVGIALEKTVLRFLYGRPLETLLATWGVSLILMQAVRTIFGAQNVQVENPAWMSGGIQVAANLTLPYNRIFIIAFAIMVLILLWAMIAKTRLGLFIRAVTQNRGMASCTGVNTSKVDGLAFGLGSGIAGLAGVALSQIGNVGPALGQGYIVDSFMVVVLGGVGQLAGAVYAAMGLGIFSKFLEGMAGAVLAKIFILVIVIIFIQKRPQGMFAFKGRSID
jgi:urea transport system permease protein